jgi:hypothetical protein
VWLVQDQHGDPIGQCFLSIGTPLGPVPLMYPSINLPLNKGNEDKAKDKTENLLECLDRRKKATDIPFKGISNVI